MEACRPHPIYIPASGCTRYHARAKGRTRGLAFRTRRKFRPRVNAKLSSGSPMIRTILMLGFWVMVVPVAALIFFPWVLSTGEILPLYRAGIWAAWKGIRIAGVKVQVEGL